MLQQFTFYSPKNLNEFISRSNENLVFQVSNESFSCSTTRMVRGCGLFLTLALLTSQCAATDYQIRFFWNGLVLNQSDVVNFSINESVEKDGVEINIKAPFYNDAPPPNARPGEVYLA